MPVIAVSRSFTKRATFARKPAALHTGGKTSATRQWSSTSATCSTTRTTTICEANFPIAWRTVSARRHATVRRVFEMLQMAAANQASMMRADADMHSHSEGIAVRSLVIGLTAFLTVVDLFATQAILPSLARHYDVTPAAMGFAVNASTMGWRSPD